MAKSETQTADPAKKDDPAKPVDPAPVKVRLLCYHSGVGETPGPGDIIAVDAAEAERLIGMKAAEAA